MATRRSLGFFSETCHVLVRLPCLLSTFPLHKEFQAAVIQPPVATDLLSQELFPPAVVANNWEERPKVIRPLSRPASRGIGGFELGVISYLNGTMLQVN